MKFYAWKKGERGTVLSHAGRGVGTNSFGVVLTQVVEVLALLIGAQKKSTL